MVQSKRLLTVFAILAVSLVPRFLLTGVRKVIGELPVKSLPEQVGEWQAAEVLVCPECQKELKEAVWQRTRPKNPRAQMVYLEHEVEESSCPIHHLPLVKTKDIPVPFIVQKVLPEGTLFLRKWYRKKASRDSSLPDVIATVVTSGTDRRSIHRPERCLPAQGWQIVSRDRWPVPMSPASEKSFQVTRLVVRQIQEKRERKEVVFYWFMSHNNLTGSNLRRMLLGWWERVFKGLNYRWSYALLTAPVGGSIGETSEDLGRFASGLLPQIRPGK